MMQYDGDLLLPKTYLVSPPEIKGVSGEYLVKNGINTFACSEVGGGLIGSCERVVSARASVREGMLLITWVFCSQRASRRCVRGMPMMRMCLLANSGPAASRANQVFSPLPHQRRPRSLATSRSSGTATAAATLTAPRRPTSRSPRTM